MGDLETRIHAFDDGRVVVESVQDVEPVLEHAKAMHNAGAGRGKDLHHLASFPAVVVEQYCKLHGITLREWLMNPVHADRMRADRDLAGFRVLG
ncbi:hypothetical protein [Sphingomonas sp.]|jgi:hypothetical protein|uniref:hypothetical protein n=1 Tax=Sphingomonas sp. TaxID=28214 RepID=UPI003566591A